MTQANVSIIRDAIEMLYLSTDVSHPSADCAIAPVSELVENTNVTCTELVKLTDRLAMEFLLREGGLIEPFDTSGNEPLAGFLYVNSNFGSIFVEQTDLLVRRRFSVAHELGHYVLHFRPLLDAVASQNQFTITGIVDAFPQSPDGTEPDAFLSGIVSAQSINAHLELPPVEEMEREANKFAAELLMPENVIHDLVSRYVPVFQGGDLVWRLATDMLVSQSAMGWRLRDLGLLPA